MPLMILKVDHLDAVTGGLDRIRGWYNRARGLSNQIACHVTHEDDDSCCLLEPWDVTALKITADDPTAKLFATTPESVKLTGV